MATLRPVLLAATKTVPTAPIPLPTLRTATPAYAAQVPDHNLPHVSVEFCGEPLPLEQETVSRRWMYVLKTHAQQTGELRLINKRAAACFPCIDPILEKYEIPADFRFLAVAESRLHQHAKSPRGAAGYWQLMPETARELGLKVGPRTDERYNLTKATDAACRYLRKLYSHLGSWSLTAAAYNSGMRYVQTQVQRQKNDNYFQLRLHPETTWYLYRVLFFKEMMTNPDPYVELLPGLRLVAPAPLVSLAGSGLTERNSEGMKPFFDPSGQEVLGQFQPTAKPISNWGDPSNPTARHPALPARRRLVISDISLPQLPSAA